MELRGRELVERIAAELTGRLGAGRAALVARQPRARCDDRVRPGSEAQRRPRRRAGRTSTRAGAWTGTGWPATMEGAIRSGLAAARALTARAPRWPAMSVATETRLDAAIEAATARLLELQHPDGYWVGELESNVTMTAQHLFWHHVLGLRTPELDRKIANELLARQRDDGTWAIWFEARATSRRRSRRTRR